MPPRVALNRKEEKRFRLRTLPFFSALMVIAIVRIMIWYDSVRFDLPAQGKFFLRVGNVLFWWRCKVLQLAGTMSLIMLATKELTVRMVEYVYMISGRWCIDFLYMYSLRRCRCGSNLFRIFAVNAPATATSCWEALRTLNKSEKSKHTTRENIACNNAAELRPHIPYHTEPYHTIYYTILYHIVRSTAASACEHTNMQIIVHTATTPTTNNPTTGGQRQQQGGTGRFVCPARQWRKTEATTWSPLN